MTGGFVCEGHTLVKNDLIAEIDHIELFRRDEAVEDILHGLRSGLEPQRVRGR